MMIECAGVAEMLGAFRDGELEPEKVAIVARHLSTCARCEVLLSEICELGETLRAAAYEPSLDGFTEQVLSRVAALREPLYQRLRRRLADMEWAWPVVATSASLATVLAGWLALTTFVGPLSTPVAPTHSGAVGEVEARLGEPVQTLGLILSHARDRVVISRLETDQRHVALWSEPQGTTTVIWLQEEPEIGD